MVSKDKLGIRTQKTIAKVKIIVRTKITERKRDSKINGVTTTDHWKVKIIIKIKIEIKIKITIKIKVKVKIKIKIKEKEIIITNAIKKKIITRAREEERVIIKIEGQKDGRGKQSKIIKATKINVIDLKILTDELWKPYEDTKKI